MSDLAHLKTLLTAQVETLIQMHSLGEQVLACTVLDQIDHALDLVAARTTIFEQLRGLPFPNNSPLPALLQHRDSSLRALAREAQFHAERVIAQDKKIQEQLRLLHSNIRAELQKTQLALQLDRTYHPPASRNSGAFIDKQR
ncbi:MAG: hypothetical protein ACOX2S_08640 [bacterium]|jgi:hypothetical protein